MFPAKMKLDHSKIFYWILIFFYRFCCFTLVSHDAWTVCCIITRGTGVMRSSIIPVGGFAPHSSWVTIDNGSLSLSKGEKHLDLSFFMLHPNNVTCITV